MKKEKKKKKGGPAGAYKNQISWFAHTVYDMPFAKSITS